jgi:hypothetical protein
MIRTCIRIMYPLAVSVEAHELNRTHVTDDPMVDNNVIVPVEPSLLCDKPVPSSSVTVTIPLPTLLDIAEGPSRVAEAVTPSPEPSVLSSDVVRAPVDPTEVEKHIQTRTPDLVLDKDVIIPSVVMTPLSDVVVDPVCNGPAETVLMSNTIHRLKSMCVERGLSTKGKKRDVVHRILSYTPVPNN